MGPYFNGWRISPSPTNSLGENLRRGLERPFEVTVARDMHSVMITDYPPRFRETLTQATSHLREKLEEKGITLLTYNAHETPHS